MQSEKLKALSAKWRKIRLDDESMDGGWGSHGAKGGAEWKCADELDAALASPSPAPSEPLREALIREMFGVQCEWCRLTEPRRVESDGYISNFGPVSVGEFVHDVAKELDYETKWCAAGYLRTWAALDSTKASEPAAPASLRSVLERLAQKWFGEGDATPAGVEIVRCATELCTELRKAPSLAATQEPQPRVEAAAPRPELAPDDFKLTDNMVNDNNALRSALMAGMASPRWNALEKQLARLLSVRLEREAPPDLASAQRGQGLVNELEREIIRLNEELHWVWRDFTMYMNAWCREIGGFIRAKSHQIDGYVLRTRDALAEAKEAGRKEGQADLAPLLERLERYLYNGFEPDNQSHLYHEVKKALAQLKVQR